LPKGACLLVALRQAQGYGCFLRRHRNTGEAFGLHQQRVVEIQRGAHNATSMQISAL
jgi:hypothetical protein